MYRFADHLTAFFGGARILELLQLIGVGQAKAASELSLLNLMAERGPEFLLKGFTKATGGDEGGLVAVPVVQLVDTPSIDQTHGHKGPCHGTAGLTPFCNARHGCQRFDHLLPLQAEDLLQGHKAALGAVVRLLHVLVHLLIQHLHHQVPWHLAHFGQFLTELVLVPGESRNRILTGIGPS